MGSASTYEGSEFAAREKVVLVFLQYRLGILGFLRWAGPGARGGASSARRLGWRRPGLVAVQEPGLQKAVAEAGGDGGRGPAGYFLSGLRLTPKKVRLQD